jgi:hypothetical protein
VDEHGSAQLQRNRMSSFPAAGLAKLVSLDTLLKTIV